MKRIVSNADRILRTACRREDVQEDYIYRNTREFLHKMQELIWLEQKEQKPALARRSRNSLEVIDTLLTQLQYFPVVGYLYADILRLNYFSNLSSSALTVRKMTGLGETAFYKRKRQAILALGLTLVGMMDREELEGLFSATDPVAAADLLAQNVTDRTEMKNAS